MDKAIPIITILMICITGSVVMFRLGYEEGKSSIAGALTDSWEEGYDMGVKNTKDFYEINKRS